MVDDANNVTKKIFENFEISSGVRDAKRTADDLEDKGVKPQEYGSLRTRVDSKLEELERGIDENLDPAIELQQDLDKLRKSEEFKDDYRQAQGVDKLAEFVDIAEDLVDHYQSMTPRFTIIKELSTNFSEEQDSMISIQQLAHDEGRVKEIVEKIADFSDDHQKRIANKFEDAVDNQNEKVEYMLQVVEELVEEMNSVKKTEAAKNDELASALNNLADAVQNIDQRRGQTRQQYNHSYQQPQAQASSPQQASVHTGGNGGQNGVDPESSTSTSSSTSSKYTEMGETKKQLIELWNDHGSDWSHSDYADELGVKRVTVTNYLKTLEEDGHIEREG